MLGPNVVLAGHLAYGPDRLGISHEARKSACIGRLYKAIPLGRRRP